MSRRILTLLCLLFATLLLPPTLGCGGGDKKKSKKAKKGKKGKKGKGSLADATKLFKSSSMAPGKGSGKSTSSRPIATATAPTKLRKGSVQANELAKGFLHWRPLPVFLADKIYDAAAIGNGNAIVLTNDNHVGVTKNSGKNWHYQRVQHGASFAVHGRAGGPFYVVGKAGFASWSKKGLLWEGLPKVTNANFMGVAANQKIAVAISRGGIIVTYHHDGSRFRGYRMPKGKWPSKIYSLGGKILIQVGREVWATKNNGTTWAPTSVHPTLPDKRVAPTSQGICKLGSVEKTWGLVCRVNGAGYAVTSKELFVVDGDLIQSSKDGGKTWKQGRVPFRGTRKVGGFSGGPYFALGARGNLSKSDDGDGWNQVQLETKGSLNDIYVSGQKALIVGSGGTILMSTNKGKSWKTVDPGAKKNFTHIVKKGSSLLLPVGGALFVSTDGGGSWSEPEDKSQYGELPKNERLSKCTDLLPKAGKGCKVSREISSPGTFPRARTFYFNGDFGILVGFKGLVAVTPDGGSTWNYNYGYKFWGSIQDLAVRGKRLVVVTHRQVLTSVNSGRTWRNALLPKRLGPLLTAFIDDDGAVYVGGERATLIKASGRLGVFRKLETDANRWAGFFKVLRAGGALYVSGLKGELYRSTNKGGTWRQIFTGQANPVVNMIAKGKTILAVTTTTKGRWWSRGRGDGALLRSDDKGVHFRVIGALSAGGTGEEFYLDDKGRIVFHNLVSADMGQTWSKYREHYWRGLRKVGDGRYVGNRRFRNSRDLFYVVASDMKRYTIIESFYHENAMIRCDPKAGCWMASGSVVYQPF